MTKREGSMTKQEVIGQNNLIDSMNILHYKVNEFHELYEDGKITVEETRSSLADVCEYFLKTCKK